jgi:hypothetical protein
LEAARLKNKDKSDSRAILVTFEGRNLPELVYLGYMAFSVKPFVPSPLRCFHCQRYGHIADVCKSKIICPRCSGTHKFSDCPQTEKRCSNCHGDHSASYGGCPEKKRVTNILKLSVANQIPIAEAKKQLPKPSFADVLKKPSIQPTQSSSSNKNPFKVTPIASSSKIRKPHVVSNSNNLSQVTTDHSYVQTPTQTNSLPDLPTICKKSDDMTKINTETIIHFVIELLFALQNKNDTSDFINIALNLACKHFNFNLKSYFLNSQTSSV